MGVWVLDEGKSINEVARLVKASPSSVHLEGRKTSHRIRGGAVS